jgi:hypothetical protein
VLTVVYVSTVEQLPQGHIAASRSASEGGVEVIERVGEWHTVNGFIPVVVIVHVDVPAVFEILAANVIIGAKHQPHERLLANIGYRGSGAT